MGNFEDFTRVVGGPNPDYSAYLAGASVALAALAGFWSEAAESSTGGAAGVWAESG